VVIGRLELGNQVAVFRKHRSILSWMGYSHSIVT
jgi:hypothetical protein